MKVLFIHRSFPGQFRSLAPALAARGDDVRALTGLADLPTPQPGVRVMRYGTDRVATPGAHPWIAHLETQVIRGEAVFEAGRQLKAQGYTPDVIVSHPRWGESLFVKEVWPEVKLGVYCELYLAPQGLDVGFDPEFPVTEPANSPICRLNNRVLDMHFDIADAGISPLAWQANTFPERFRPKIEVIHDGVDTAAVAPNPDIQIRLGEQLNLTRADEIVTFVSRQFEPLRGAHVFMRALPEILAKRPRARVVIVGGETAHAYGPPPADAPSWRQRSIAEMRGKISEADWARVHFIDQLPYNAFIGLLQLSSVHVYLSYPYVLSWSLIEAMSAGCAIVASKTGPVPEVIRDGEAGRLVDFFDIEGLAETVCSLLANPAERQRLGAAARVEAIEKFDLKTVCLPKQIAWVDRLAGL